MSKEVKILINGVTLEEGNIIPLLSKIKNWQDSGNKISIIGNKCLKEKIEKFNILKREYKFIELKATRKIENKFYLIFEGLRRNLQLIKTIKNYNSFDIVYSISSVLDLVIFPFYLKIISRRIKWATVFDNKVPLNDPGNKIVRFLAWVFFHLSLVFLRKADYVFAISKDLRNYLIKKGFDRNKIILTGNAVENNLIKKARKKENSNIDALFVGRINETKGIYDMLKVLEIVKKKYLNFQLAFIGTGDKVTENQFRNKILEMNLGGNIQFLGYQTGLEKFNFIKSSKCFWFLSKSESESFGIALLEAVCCGLWAFVYDLVPFRSIYKNNEIIVSKIGDYRSVAKKVIELFDKKDFDNPHGKLLLNKYNWGRIAKIELDNFSKNKK